MEKLNKDELSWCVEWVTGAANTPGPLPKEYYIGKDKHELLWRFALLHRREAGKLRVVHNGLFWKGVSVYPSEATREDPGKVLEPVDQAMGEFNRSHSPKPLSKFTLHAGVMMDKRLGYYVAVDFDMDAEDLEKLRGILNLGVFAPSIKIDLVNRK